MLILTGFLWSEELGCSDSESFWNMYCKDLFVYYRHKIMILVLEEQFKMIKRNKSKMNNNYYLLSAYYVNGHLTFISQILMEKL